MPPPLQNQHSQIMLHVWIYVYLCLSLSYRMDKDMKRLQFEVEIAASCECVWFALWDEAHYARWTRVFAAGSRAVSDWGVGAEIEFLSAEGAGLYSRIERNAPFSEIFFTHLGAVTNGVRTAFGAESAGLIGAQENYILSVWGEGTRLIVELDTLPDHVAYFQEMFPKALALAKEAAENMCILVEATLDAPLARVWDAWTSPEHIVQWNFASEEWHCPSATNNLQVGGVFSYRMEARDGSFGFDFKGLYLDVLPQEKIIYDLGEDRLVVISFSTSGNKTMVLQAFVPETQNALSLQKQGWQSIMNNFVKHVETLN